MDIPQVPLSTGMMQPPTAELPPPLPTVGDPNDPPGILIKDKKNLKTGTYPINHIKGFIAAAKAVGIDPNTMLALSLQEEGLGTHKQGRGTRLGQAYLDDNQVQEMGKISQANPNVPDQYLRAALALRDKLAYAKSLGFTDEAKQLQAYNGYGTLTKENMGSDKAYGVPIGNGINMRTHPLYGMRLLELKSSIASNKDIQSLIKG